MASLVYKLTFNHSYRQINSQAATWSVLAGSLSSRSKGPYRATFEAPPEEYTGPKLYVKPSSKQKSNRTIIINAVSHCCLAGVVNTGIKNKVLEVREPFIANCRVDSK